MNNIQHLSLYSLYLLALASRPDSLFEIPLCRYLKTSWTMLEVLKRGSSNIDLHLYSRNAGGLFWESCFLACNIAPLIESWEACVT